MKNRYEVNGDITTIYIVTNQSGYTGVHWDKSRNKWRASIMIDYKRKNLGYFTDKEEAIRARKSAEAELFEYNAKSRKPCC